MAIMAGEVTEAVTGCAGCLILIAIVSVLLVVGYFAFHIIQYLLPVAVAVIICLAVIYGIGYVIFALLTVR